jgi:ABC-2 type transport system ATP-binding protein
VRVDGDPAAALGRLRQRGFAGPDAFAVGATLTIPLHRHTSSSVLDELAADAVATVSVATRKPTLDDVYLQLTGASLAA